MHRSQTLIGFLLFLTLSSSAQQRLPDNMFTDTAYTPFSYGVASGDPIQTKVIIWTKVSMPASATQPITLQWQVASDTLFTSIINKGSAICIVQSDYTTQADVDGLLPGHHYFYRFITADGKVSQTGKAQTLPDDTVTHFKLALVSCAGAWSGYFNAYRRIAERSDIDLLLHVGDYIYDDVDPDEHVRMPIPEPQTPKTLADWRNRHKYYLLDPDLRLARQNKTWIVEWDNHDTHYKEFEKNADGVTAFYEYVPIRMPDTTHPERIYRSFHIGNLADLTMIDMYMFRSDEEFAPGSKSILGNIQDEWFKTSLLRSTSTWHLIGNQEMMGSWLSEGIPKALRPPGDGKYFDPGDWDGYNDDRNRLYHFLDSNQINNFVTLSGDLHMSFVMDLTSEPRNRKLYNRKTGKGAVGVEVLTPSLTAGNMDEEHVPLWAIPIIQRISLDLNPHHRWVQFTKHGYTCVEITPEHCVAQFCYSDILDKATTETYSRAFEVKNGMNHWERKFYKPAGKKH